jgi:predicted O-linked N-acetylglucosamine transferase (SPINDLY family)
MDAFTAHLVSQRMAALQVGFWGHPFSAASTTIDYFISSDGFQESWQTAKTKAAVSTDYYEQVVLMESFSANVLADREYERGGDMDEMFVKHHGLGTREDYVGYVVARGFDLFNRPYQHGWKNETATERLHIYTCLQSIMKMHPLFDEILVGLLQRDPNAVIILLSSLKSKFISQLKLQQRLLDTLLRAGADPTRIIFMPQISSTVYSQIVCGADVTLDPVPFGGGVTLSDSVRCNVPFVTSGKLLFY